MPIFIIFFYFYNFNLKKKYIFNTVSGVILAFKANVFIVDLTNFLSVLTIHLIKADFKVIEVSALHVIIKIFPLNYN
jgi:hypothetical protein